MGGYRAVQFVILWVLATLIGAIIGEILARQLSSLIFEPFYIPSAEYISFLLSLLERVVGASVIGLAIGIGQWLVLWGHHYTFKWWPLATVAGFALGVFFSEGLWGIIWLLKDGGTVAIEIVEETTSPRLAVTALMDFAIRGFLLGLCQWAAMREQVRGGVWWIVWVTLGGLLTNRSSFSDLIVIFVIGSGVLIYYLAHRSIALPDEIA